MTTTPLFLRSADGVEVALWDLGGEGPTLLLAHATGFCAQVWQPLADHLTSRYRCWAIDSRGHGRTLASLDQLGWDRCAADLAMVCEHLGPGPVYGVGHSMGGATLLRAASVGARLARLWVFEPIAIPPSVRRPPGDNPMIAAALRRRANFADAAVARANYSSKPPLDALHPDALDAYVTHGFASGPGGITLRCRPESEARTYEEGNRHDTFERLGLVTCPVTVAVGAEGDPGPAAFAPEVAAALPHGRLRRFPELGHFGPLEDPAGVAAAVAVDLTP